jgi:hypothetical protein
MPCSPLGLVDMANAIDCWTFVSLKVDWRLLPFEAQMHA